MFHSALGRKFITKVINENNIKNASNINNSCPNPAIATKSYLLGVVKKYMQKGITENQKNLSNFTNNVSQNSGGSIKNVEDIYKKLFDKESYAIKKNTIGDISHFMARGIFGSKKFNLSHAYIRVGNSSNGSGHAISGAIKNDGRPIVIDSHDRVYDIDWTTQSGQKQLITIYSKTLKLDSIIVNAVYIDPEYVKTNVGPRYFNPNYFTNTLVSRKLIQNILNKEHGTPETTKNRILKRNLQKTYMNNNAYMTGGNKNLFEKFVISELRKEQKKKILNDQKYSSLKNINYKNNFETPLDEHIYVYTNKGKQLKYKYDSRLGYRKFRNYLNQKLKVQNGNAPGTPPRSNTIRRPFRLPPLRL